MSGSERNADVVRRGYAAFNRADVDTLSEVFAENSSWHTPGNSAAAGDAIGRDKVFASADGRVVGLHHNSGERNGKQLDTDCCIVFELEDGRITSGREYFYDLDNWDAFWS